MYRERIHLWFAASPLRQRAVDWLVAGGAPAYLVGGSVRDALLGRDAEDLDVAIEGDALRVARRLADYMHGAFVALDSDRNVGRVVVRGKEGPMHIDLASLRAEGILADLAARDFTVNAMAVPLGAGGDELLDPTGGRSDLEARQLRLTHALALKDDPLRVLRGVRLRGKLGFEVEPTTEKGLREWAPLLQTVSAERIREEWLQILDLNDAANSFDYCRQLGLVALVLPAFAAYPQAQEEAARLLSCADALVASILHASGLPAGHLSSLATQMGSAWVDLAHLWGQEVSVGHRRATILKLATLFAEEPLSTQSAAQAGSHLRLSRAEVRLLRHAVGASRYLNELSADEDLKPLWIYRYYKRFGDAGVDGALLAWVTRIAQGNVGASNESFLAGRVARVAQAWFNEQATWISPAPLLSGRDLIDRLGLEQGPLVGRLMDVLAEAQVQQLVKTPDAAGVYLREWLSR